MVLEDKHAEGSVVRAESEALREALHDSRAAHREYGRQLRQERMRGAQVTMRCEGAAHELSMRASPHPHTLLPSHDARTLTPHTSMCTTSRSAAPGRQCSLVATHVHDVMNSASDERSATATTLTPRAQQDYTTCYTLCYTSLRVFSKTQCVTHVPGCVY